MALSPVQKFHHMFSLLPHSDDNEQGFTLIELLVVIMIIGILSAIAVPAFMNQRKAAAEAAMKSDLRNASMSVTSKMDKMGNYPDALPPGTALSEGVYLTYAASKTSYCLKAAHAAVDTIWYYDSAINGTTTKSCSMKLDSVGSFYPGVAAGGVIYQNSGEWVQEGTGPTGESVMALRKFPGTDMGWGIIGQYGISGQNIPAGSTVRMSFLVKGDTAGKYVFDVANNSATSRIAPGKTLTTGTDWSRESHTFTLTDQWVAGYHYMRFSLSFAESEPRTVYFSDVQVDVISAP